MVEENGIVGRGTHGGEGGKGGVRGGGHIYLWEILIGPFYWHFFIIIVVYNRIRIFVLSC